MKLNVEDDTVTLTMTGREAIALTEALDIAGEHLEDLHEQDPRTYTTRQVEWVQWHASEVGKARDLASTNSDWGTPRNGHAQS